MQYTFASAEKAAAMPSARATLRYIVYKSKDYMPGKFHSKILTFAPNIGIYNIVFCS